MRRCPARRCPQLIQDSEKYCAQHLAEYEAKRGTSANRGYGTQHRALRTQWAQRIEANEQPTCSRCGLPILAGQAWHLDHTDDRHSYLGPAHKHCNESAGGTRGARTVNQADSWA